MKRLAASPRTQPFRGCSSICHGHRGKDKGQAAKAEQSTAVLPWAWRQNKGFHFILLIPSPPPPPAHACHFCQAGNLAVVILYSLYYCITDGWLTNYRTSRLDLRGKLCFGPLLLLHTCTQNRNFFVALPEAGESEIKGCTEYAR